MWSFNRRWTVSMCSAFINFWWAGICLSARKSCNWITFAAIGFRIIGPFFWALSSCFRTRLPSWSYLLTTWLLFQGHRFSFLWKWECFGSCDFFQESAPNHWLKPSFPCTIQEWYRGFILHQCRNLDRFIFIFRQALFSSIWKGTIWLHLHTCINVVFGRLILYVLPPFEGLFRLLDTW
jgi:hypothetical protein